MTHNILLEVLGAGRNVIELDRETIEKADVSAHAARIKALTATRESVLANNGSLSLRITGYEADPRQPFEIAEVRRFFMRLNDHEPQWFHLCNRTDETLKLVFMCTARAQTAASIGARSIGHTWNREHLRSFLMRHYHAMKGLHEEFAVPQSTSELISGLVISYFKTLTVSKEIALQ